MNYHKIDGCIYYRNFLPAIYLEAASLGQNKLINRFETRTTVDEDGKEVGKEYQLGIVKWADILVLSRYYSLNYTDLIRTMVTAAKEFGTKIVYEADDDVINIPESNPVAKSAIEAKPLTEAIIKSADAVFVTTERLGKTLESVAKKPTFVLPNSVELYRFNEALAARGDHDEIRIGWAGGRTHGDDIKLMFGGVERILSEYKNVKFVTLTSLLMHELMNFPHEFHPFVSTDVFPETLTNLGIDIALIPLEDNKFNSGKSPIKWVEFSAAKAASIYSNVAPYGDYIVDGKTGLAVGSPDDWYPTIKKLIDDVKLRKELARAAYKEVAQKYSMEKNIMLWEKAYSDVINLNN